MELNENLWENLLKNTCSQRRKSRKSHKNETHCNCFCASLRLASTKNTLKLFLFDSLRRKSPSVGRENYCLRLVTSPPEEIKRRSEPFRVPLLNWGLIVIALKCTTLIRDQLPSHCDSEERVRWFRVRSASMARWQIAQEIYFVF